ncbi:hypothetical protein DFH28DRAFT_1050914 [Melampsora americana]|nr:hypothetical protein DFH28DRAFT_1050914 [Melampsora americana]
MPAQSHLKTHLIFKWVKVVTLGSMGNMIVGGLTGFLGSLCLQHHPLLAISIIWISALAAVIAGLLHAIIIFSISHHFTTSIITKWNHSLSQDLLYIFTQAPLLITIGIAISYTILVESPVNVNHQSSNPLSFLLVLYTTITGTLMIGMYSTVLFHVTKSRNHLLILQNCLILSYFGFLLESSQTVTDIVEDVHSSSGPLLQEVNILS